MPKAVVIGKCFLCPAPVYASDDKSKVYIQGRYRLVHTRCADSTSNLEAVAYRVTQAFPGTDVVNDGIGIGIKEYLLTQAQNAANDPLAQELAESWHSSENPPKVGDVLIGFVVSVDIGQNNYGPYPIVTVADENDNGAHKAWHGFGTVGINQFNKVRPKQGERVRIECTQVATQRGVIGDYTAWNIRVDRELTDDALDRVFGRPENRQETKTQDEEPPF